MSETKPISDEDLACVREEIDMYDKWEPGSIMPEEHARGLLARLVAAEAETNRQILLTDETYGKLVAAEAEVRELVEFVDGQDCHCGSFADTCDRCQLLAKHGATP